MAPPRDTAGTVVGIDTGGTFTDFLLVRGGRLTVHKVLSTPGDPSRAILQGLAELDMDDADSTVFVHGSTVATNALLERKGAVTALIATEGLEDVLELGRQARPRLYDLTQQLPPPLVPRRLRFGVRERVAADGSVLLALTRQEALDVAEEVGRSGAQAVCVSLLFSFLAPAHEELLHDALAALDPPLFLSISSRVLPQYREYERTSTVAVNAYVGPLMSSYLQRLEEALGGGGVAGSRKGRGRSTGASRVRVMQSSGGSISARAAADQPVRTILSGPAGGVVGAYAVASEAGYPDIITLDMGGTSTDVAVCPGRVQETDGAMVGGVPVAVPMIDIHTVGAGGGSIARVDAGGALLVGPESAGADPGPACYGRGQEATVTDANLLLGRMAPGHFLGGRMVLDPERALGALELLASAMGGREAGVSAEQAAVGVVRVVNAAMERALRTISLERGFDPRQFTLVAFGGAGPQHACELAQELHIPRVLVPRFPGALSAYGVAIADLVKDYSRTVMLGPEALTRQALADAFVELEARGRRDLRDEGVPARGMELRRLLDMRYVGQSYELTVEWPGARGKRQEARGKGVVEEAVRRFHQAHQQRFGHSDQGQPVEVVNVRLKAVARMERPQPVATKRGRRKAEPLDRREVFFGGERRETAFYLRPELAVGQRVPGPAVLLQEDATTVIPPGWTARVDAWGNLVVEL